MSQISVKLRGSMVTSVCVCMFGIKAYWVFKDNSWELREGSQLVRWNVGVQKNLVHN